MMPLSYYLAFSVGKHVADYKEIALCGELTQSSEIAVMGLGQYGTWLALAIGLIHIIIW
jgi:hypothetical protein